MERTYLTCADTAKLLRAALKSNFPGVKFSVRSSVYSGGASIRVNWIDGPFIKEVDPIAQRYAGATFDGSIDLKEYHTDLVHFDGEEMPRLVRFGSDFVFTDRDLSPEYQAYLAAEAQKILDLNDTTRGKIFAMDEKLTGQEYLYTPYGTYNYPHAYGSNLVRFLSHHVAAPNWVSA